MSNQSSKDEELRDKVESLFNAMYQDARQDRDGNPDHIEKCLALIQSEKQKSEQTIRLHRQEAHLAGRITEAQSILSGYTKTYGASSILNSVLKKRIKKYRKELQDVFTEHNREALKQTKEVTE